MELNDSPITIRKAVKDDLIEIKYLLDSYSLPTVDIEKHLPHFLVLIDGRRIIGTIGMEVYGKVALLRSLAVNKDFQNRGYGRKLCRMLISKLKKMKVGSIYLLTETAEGFFRREGFNKTSREVAPPLIKQTYEYTTLCPDDAVCMVMKIVS